jgi:hypothetical protein
VSFHAPQGEQRGPPLSGREAEELFGEPMGTLAGHVAVILGVIASGITIILFAPHITFVIGKIDSAFALLNWLLTGPEVRAWRVSKLWQRAPEFGVHALRRSAWARGILLPLIAAAFWFLPASVFDVVAFAVLFIWLSGTRWWLREQLMYLAFLLEYDPKAAHAPSTTQTDRITLGRALRRPRRVASIAGLATLTAASLSVIAVAAGVRTKQWSPSDASPLGSEASGSSSSSGDSSSASPRSETQPSGGEVDGSHESGAELKRPCEAVAFEPGVPQRVVAEVEELYAGTHQLGRESTGCPTEVREQSTSDGVLYWTLAKGSGATPTSIAVISPRFHRALVLWPAGKAVQRMIERGTDVGGTRDFPRYYAGGGSYYLLRTDIGSIVVIQRQTGTLIEARPYVTLPSSAASAWLSALRELDIWQWPSESKRDGDVVYTLHAIEPVARQIHIIYSPSGRTAVRGTATGSTVPYIAHQQLIRATELRQWRPAIPADEIPLELAQGAEEELDPAPLGR